MSCCTNPLPDPDTSTCVMCGRTRDNRTHARELEREGYRQLATVIKQLQRGEKVKYPERWF